MDNEWGIKCPICRVETKTETKTETTDIVILNINNNENINPETNIYRHEIDNVQYSCNKCCIIWFTLLLVGGFGILIYMIYKY